MLGRFEAAAFGSSAWYAYLRDLGLRYWPWLPLAYFGASRLFRSDGRIDRLVLIWALGTLVLLHLLPRKYDRYLLFVYPALAILAAYGLQLSRFWRPWCSLLLPNAGWAAALTLAALQLAHVKFHVTGYPELARTIPLMHGTVYALRGVPMPVQCNIRFFSDARVKLIDGSTVFRMESGDILVVPRAAASNLPPHSLLAEGKELRIIKID